MDKPTYTLTLTTEDRNELLTLFNVALAELTQREMRAEIVRRGGGWAHDPQQTEAARAEQAILRAWITRLSQLAPESEAANG